ncbi:MAG: hypothetical protein A2X94_03295 [Bdellovibrionales bacterium GWB1_55_8]|nr:MAG: hypothetical protein A2X94_03295 [Bdellovibrionales bacterium GWB1_55_8]
MQSVFPSLVETWRTVLVAGGHGLLARLLITFSTMRAVKPIPPKDKISTEDPELAERFNRVLEEAVEAMEGSGIRYAFIGGVASGSLGRPRSTHDIDLFVMPEDAELSLRALGRKGFRTERTDPAWLYKGFKDGILVDVIFKSKGDIYLDSEMYQRMTSAEFHGKRLRFVAPEDLLIIKAVAHSELTPSHWHDAIALLTHARIDWDYLIRRARRAPRRILSLLLYAQSNDIGVPNWVIHALFEGIFGNTAEGAGERAAKEPSVQPPAARPQIYSAPRAAEEKITPEWCRVAVREPTPGGMSYHARDEYGVGHLHERLAEDPRTNELDIQIEQSGNTIILRGEVNAPERRKAVEQVAREYFPNTVIINEVRVLELKEPPESEPL